MGTRTAKCKRELKKCLSNNMMKLLKILVGENRTNQQPLLPLPPEKKNLFILLKTWHSLGWYYSSWVFWLRSKLKTKRKISYCKQTIEHGVACYVASLSRASKSLECLLFEVFLTLSLSPWHVLVHGCNPYFNTEFLLFITLNVMDENLLKLTVK